MQAVLCSMYQKNNITKEKLKIKFKVTANLSLMHEEKIRLYVPRVKRFTIRYQSVFSKASVAAPLKNIFPNNPETMQHLSSLAPTNEDN